MSEPTPEPAATPAPASGAAPAPVAAPASVAAPPAVVAATDGPGVPTTPRRSFLDPASIRPTIVVAIIIAALFYGTKILNEALPAAASDVPVSASGAVTIGDGATIVPAEGWTASTHDSGEGIRLEQGIVAVDLYAETFGSNATDLATAYRDEVLKSGTTQFTATTIETFTSTNGTPAARFRYQGVFTGADVAIEGEVSVLFDNGHGVVADAWTRQGALDEALGDVHEMLQSVRVRP